MGGEAGAILPLRATTVGESLDGAVALLRQRALPMLGVGAVLAAGEQILLHHLRERAGLTPPFYWVNDDAAAWWSVVVTGLALETAIITLLGGYAGAAVGPALLGRPVRHRALWRHARIPSAVLVAIILGQLAWPGGYVLFGAVTVYALFGLATPSMAMEGYGNPFRALVRSARLSSRGGMRVARIRILGYLTWLAVRAGLGIGWYAVASLAADMSGRTWMDWVVPVAWALANTVAYPALACLDAVLLVEARIRTEGLDIAVNRSRALGGDDAAVLAVTR
ncbi:hypothetical protein [Actinoplanes sp. NPDC051851]|uniref:hypothetical protein n=1 Tax=Actinoplanes sp. NPDC051851 TaxID=3154753 RepID=UPI0034397282